MSKPDFVPSGDWNLVTSIATAFPQEPYLIAAIGWHETNWGRIGAGPGGWYLGYGYYPGSPVKEKYRGLAAQIRGAHAQISRDLKLPLTQSSLTTFALDSWRSSAPVSWARSVWSIYSGLVGEGVSEAPPAVSEEEEEEETVFPEAVGEARAKVQRKLEEAVPDEEGTKTYWKDAFTRISEGCLLRVLFFITILVIVLTSVRC